MRKLSYEEIFKTRPKLDELSQQERYPFYCLAEDVRSLYNVGSIFRTSDAVKLNKLYLTGYTGFPPRREIEKTALGSTESVPWEHFKQTDWVCAYAYCEVISPVPVAAQLRVGTNDMGAVWFNGTNILSQNTERSATLDDDILSVQLQKGKNRILLKVCNTGGNWGLYLRITDKDGNDLQDLKFWPE